MRKYGMKLWSGDICRNDNFIQESLSALKGGKFDYLELFTLPESFEKTAELWRHALVGIETIIHAPHSCFNLDTGNAEAFESNCKILESSFRFADMLKSEIIIVHAGMGEGDSYLDETIRQFNKFADSRIAVENLPYFCSSTGKILHGTSPKQIARIKDECGCKFCFDFSHAVCAANYYKRDVYEDIAAYFALTPEMYHMCDGQIDETEDKHLHYGEGNYDLSLMLNTYTDKNARITMETGKGIPTSIEEWLNDVRYLKSLEQN